MPDSPILFEIVLVFGAALAVIALSHRLRVPAVVGFLLAGILIGPYGLELVPAAESFFLAPGHWACGRSIRELDLRRSTGATILAVLRDEEVLSHPQPELVLQDGDTLVLVGDHGPVNVALIQLETSVFGSSVKAPAGLLRDPPATLQSTRNSWRAHD